MLCSERTGCHCLFVTCPLKAKIIILLHDALQTKYSNCLLFLHSVSLMKMLFVCALVEVNISGINDFHDNIFNVLEKYLLTETI